MTAAAVKASIERTMKLNQGAAYIWGAVKSIDAPDATTVVFHLKYAAPLDLIASADYAAYIYDTQARPARTTSASGSRRATRPAPAPTPVAQWNKGQEIELRLKSVPRLLGRLVRRPLQERRLPRRPAGHDRGPAAAFEGQVTWVEQMTPQLWQSLKDQDAGSRPRRRSSSWQTLLAMLNTSYGPLADAQRAPGRLASDRLDGLVAALQAFTRSSLSGVIPTGPVGSRRTCPCTEDRRRPGATALLKQAGYGPGGKPMTLTLTYTQGRRDEELRRLAAQVGPREAEHQSQRPGLAVADAVGEGQVLRTPLIRQDILLFYWWPDYADPYSWFINLFHTEQPAVLQPGLLLEPVARFA